MLVYYLPLTFFLTAFAFDRLRGDSGFGNRDSGFGIRESGFGIRESGIGIRDSGWLAPINFLLGRYPVTNAQFQEFVDDNGYHDESFWTKAKRHLVAIDTPTSHSTGTSVGGFESFGHITSDGYQNMDLDWSNLRDWTNLALWKFGILASCQNA